MFSYHKKKTANFMEAKDSCKSLGMTLARVKDADTWNKLTEYKDAEAEYGYWWLGAEKEEASNEYFWSDGSAYRQFDPDLKISQNGLGKRCLALYTHTPLNKVKLFSLPCDRHLYYICERQTESFTAIFSKLNQSTATSGGYTATSGDTRMSHYENSYTSETVATSVQEDTVGNEILSRAYYGDADMDLGHIIWMFVSLILGLLLVISIVYIAKLCADLKRMKKRYSRQQAAHGSPKRDYDQEEMNMSSIKNNDA
uniref:uncharacterized protein LOC120329940 n=1 Tax=Styela clava TaxID=7725 RepID=UPI00193A5466|nr:uncharacterized protein LOC120329940 [Styela clava]